MLPNRQKVDISSFSEQEKELFQKYGKVPAQKNLLANKLKERKYFDSGDYAMSKAGVSPPQSVGTAIPSPADIPHASPPGQSGGSGAQAIPGASTSPTSGDNVGVGVSPGKEPSFGSPSREAHTQMGSR
ncbi:uncharacterized protein JCM10292_005774 [Rhodotorula paludigena]|uniref:mRNA stability protein n=1 Tax=Rhodotorula paludigena TaxID=86838 RepID=A0AAV5H0T0_9BASI|nr:hypothetical protein Rhopal_007417-T1 [Rhodotorula paludigena]